MLLNDIWIFKEENSKKQKSLVMGPCLKFDVRSFEAKNREFEFDY